MSKRKTTVEFKNEVTILTNGEYELASEYVNNQTKVEIIHHKCGNHYMVTPNVFKNGRRCPYCNGGVKSSKEEFLKKVKELVGDEYTVDGDYVNGHTKIRMIHNTESPHEYLVTPTWFLAGSRCPKCRGLSKKTQEQFTKEVFDLVGDEYTVLGEYQRNSIKIEFKHNIANCNRTFSMTPKDFLRGMRCPLCKESKGERMISEILDRYNIDYTRKYKIEECRNKYVLEFDFMIPYDDGTFCLLEFDGRLHYQPWKNNKQGIEHLQRQKENDAIKNKYCEENEIQLIRIPYWKTDDLENILKKAFKLE